MQSRDFWYVCLSGLRPHKMKLGKYVGDILTTFRWKIKILSSNQDHTVPGCPKKEFRVWARSGPELGPRSEFRARVGPGPKICGPGLYKKKKNRVFHTDCFSIGRGDVFKRKQFCCNDRFGFCEHCDSSDMYYRIMLQTTTNIQQKICLLQGKPNLYSRGDYVNWFFRRR